MLILKTDKSVRRYCAYCKAPMIVTKDTDEIFAGHCPQRDYAANHETVLTYTGTDSLRRYALELFAPKKDAGGEVTPGCRPRNK